MEVRRDNGIVLLIYPQKHTSLNFLSEAVTPLHSP